MHICSLAGHKNLLVKTSSSSTHFASFVVFSNTVVFPMQRCTWVSYNCYPCGRLAMDYFSKMTCRPSSNLNTQVRILDSLLMYACGQRGTSKFWIGLPIWKWKSFNFFNIENRPMLLSLNFSGVLHCVHCFAGHKWSTIDRTQVQCSEWKILLSVWDGNKCLLVFLFQVDPLQLKLGWTSNKASFLIP